MRETVVVNNLLILTGDVSVLLHVVEVMLQASCIELFPACLEQTAEHATFSLRKSKRCVSVFYLCSLTTALWISPLVSWGMALKMPKSWLVVCVYSTLMLAARFVPMHTHTDAHSTDTVGTFFLYKVANKWHFFDLKHFADQRRKHYWTSVQTSMWQLPVNQILLHSFPLGASGVLSFYWQAQQGAKVTEHVQKWFLSKVNLSNDNVWINSSSECSAQLPCIIKGYSWCLLYTVLMLSLLTFVYNVDWPLRSCYP